MSLDGIVRKQAWLHVPLTNMASLSSGLFAVFCNK